MTQDELDLILQEGEGYKIEFKENVNNTLSTELVAFANASGGKILIGVRDDKSLLSLTNIQQSKTQVQDISNNCDPPINILFEEFNNILIVNVTEGTNKPYRCTSGFYLRVGPISQKLTTQQIIDFIQSEGRIRFDELQNNECNFPDSFSKNLLTKYLQLADITKTIEDISILKNLSVIDSENEETKFRNSGVLFFTENPSQFIPQAIIVCARYEGNEKVDISDRKELKGDLISNIESSIDFIKNHLKIKIKIEGSRRSEVPELPEVAIREAVVNAVAHRDYFEKGANIMIEIFNNRVEFTNPGGLPKGFPVDEFGSISLCRNPTIASLLLRTKYIEKMGTGINRIKKVFRDNNLPDPIFKYDSFFRVTFKRKDLMFSFRNEYKIEENPAIRMTDILEKLYKRQKVDVNEISKKHSVSDRTIRNDLEKLSELELIQSSGISKDKVYQITAKGDEFTSENI